MTEQEVQPFLGKAVRVTMADGRVLAGIFRPEDPEGKSHRHYVLTSHPVREGAESPREVVRVDQIVTIEDASSDPAAR